MDSMPQVMCAKAEDTKRKSRIWSCTDKRCNYGKLPVSGNYMLRYLDHAPAENN